MAQVAQLSQVAQVAQSGPKWPKVAQSSPGGPKWPRVAQIASARYICWKIQKPTFFWDALYKGQLRDIFSLKQSSVRSPETFLMYKRRRYNLSISGPPSLRYLSHAYFANIYFNFRLGRSLISQDKLFLWRTSACPSQVWI